MNRTPTIIETQVPLYCRTNKLDLTQCISTTQTNCASNDQNSIRRVQRCKQGRIGDDSVTQASIKRYKRKQKFRTKILNKFSDMKKKNKRLLRGISLGKRDTILQLYLQSTDGKMVRRYASVQKYGLYGAIEHLLDIRRVWNT